jgi:hypothetical protein
MKTTLLSLFVLIGSQLLAQNWCPPGAEWHYSYMSLPEEGFVHYRYSKDTVFENVACRQIESTVYNSQHGPPGFHQYDTSQGNTIYTYSSNDTVYFYYSRFGKWAPAYFFDAQVGDTLIITNYALHSSSDSTVLAVVDSVGIMQVHTQQLRYYEFQLTDSVSWCNFRGKVVEKLGMMDNNLIPYWHCITDDYSYYFCSYEDSATALYPSNAVCRFIINDVHQIDNSQSAIRISPNPATTSITLQLQQIPATPTAF